MKRSFLSNMLTCLVVYAVSNSVPIKLSSEELVPGQYDVGITEIISVDRSRSFDWGTRNRGDKSSYSARPVRSVVWYPGERKDNQESITFEDFLDLASLKQHFAKPTTDSKRDHLTNINEFIAVNFSGETSVQELLSFRTESQCYRDIPRYEGLFPIFVYASSLNGEAFENFVFCEYIASHGIIVAALPSIGHYSADMPLNATGLEAQARDIEQMLSLVSEWPEADTTRITLSGYSWGGLSALISTMRNTNVDAYVSIDGSIALYSATARNIPTYDESSLRVPSIFFSSSSTIGDLTEFITNAVYSDRSVAEMRLMNHGQFNSYDYIERAINERNSGEADSIKTSYQLFCESTLAFLNTVFSDLRTIDAKDPCKHKEFNSEFVSCSYTPVFSVPLRPDEFLNLAEESGSVASTKAYDEIKAANPNYHLFNEWDLINLAYYFANDLSNTNDGLGFMKLVVREFPKSYKTRGHLANMYFKSGDDDSALTYFKEALKMATEQARVDSTLNVQPSLDWYSRRIAKLEAD